MAGLFDKQADLYLEGRPNYPKEWFSWLADRTSRHSLAWDVGTGNGQAAISVIFLSLLYVLYIYTTIKCMFFTFTLMGRSNLCYIQMG